MLAIGEVIAGVAAKADSLAFPTITAVNCTNVTNTYKSGRLLLSGGGSTSGSQQVPKPDTFYIFLAIFAIVYVIAVAQTGISFK